MDTYVEIIEEYIIDDKRNYKWHSNRGELIRCKDCYWWTKQTDSLRGKCGRNNIYPFGDWFCAGARKRELA